jgi:DNA polymerase sigma
MAVHKFTKWIEVRVVTSITSKEAAKFIEDITHSFGVPNRIITDLGSAFIRADFWDFYQDYLIDVCYSLVAHPCCNGQVEHANDMVLQGIKVRIFTTLPHTPLIWLACCI